MQSFNYNISEPKISFLRKIILFIKNIPWYLGFGYTYYNS